MRFASFIPRSLAGGVRGGVFFSGASARLRRALPRPLPRAGGEVLAALLLCVSPAFAQPVTPPAHYANVQLADPAKEASARALMETLRCLVCQGQSIADSDADMAADMRALVRERIERGEKPASIRDWLIARYGDYVTYDPPLSGLTWPLWLAPILLLGVGGWIARSSFRRRTR
ncbi:MAG: cytochrome C biogenesis protein [Sphingomonas taxi]|uniref:Cytochrome c-type biogenesis protein n=1 Tax=Sphingomonas taxi TaxID=1549858 RepID=A0A2W4YYR0_9SPHN|nr:MAG: cytochrome C biogenesis protein [Sphingomonas taxi]